MKKNLVIAALALVVSFLVANMFQNWFTLNKDEKLSRENSTVKSGGLLDQQNPAKIRKNSDSTTIAEKDIKPSQSIGNTLTPQTQDYINNTLLPSMKKGEKELVEFNKVKAVLSGEVPAAIINIGQNKAVKISYQNKYLTIITEQDEKGNVVPAKYTYDAEIIHARTVKKPVLLFWQKEKVQDIWTSPDVYFKVNGVENYTQEIEVPKTVFQLRADAGLQVGFKNPENSNFKAGITAVINQDRFVSPQISVGKLWNMSDGKSDNYGAIQVNFNIFKVRK